MNRSVLFQVGLLMTIVTSVVAVLMLYLLPSRQESELEQSVRDELSGLSLAYSISIQSALEQENLGVLAELNQQIAADTRSPKIAIISEVSGAKNVFAFFPESEDVPSIGDIYSSRFLLAERTFKSAIFDGVVVVMFERSILENRLRLLNLPIYLAFAVICLLQILFARQLYSRILMPVIEASSFADRLGEGNYKEVRAKSGRTDEIGTLATSLRRLKTRLRLQQRENQRLFLSLEDTVESRTAELREALKAKDAFTASVSHELRTPLHSIIASLDLMPDKADTESNERNYLRIAKRASQALLVLINELLDFQRWEHEQIVLNPEPAVLHAFLQDIERTTEILFDDSVIKFRALMTETRGFEVAFDPKRLEQILLNLLSNARKFTREGEVSLEVSLLSQTAFDAEFLFVIADTGIGISQQDLKRIGEPYFQAADGLNRKYSGTGLGLNIVKQLLEAMGARLNVSSQLGEGTVFDFSLKLSKAAVRADGAADQATEAAASKLKHREILDILYVEDSQTNQLVMNAMMEQLGMKLSIASSAAEGFELLKAEQFPIVITDIQMPEHSGLDLLEWIKAEPSLPHNLRVFACTANADADAVREFKELGFEAVLTKPVDLQTLEAFLANL